MPSGSWTTYCRSSDASDDEKARRKRTRRTDLLSSMNVKPLDLSRLAVLPLAQRQSLTRAEDILIDPDAPAVACSERNAALIADCAQKIVAARKNGATVMLI